MNEDELRAAMRAHDDEAPRADELTMRPIHRRASLPIAAAVVLTGAVVAVSALVWARPTDHTNNASDRSYTALACPRHYAAPRYGHTGSVPAAARGFDAKARLAPKATPSSVVVCSYPTHPGRSLPLQASRQLGGDLTNVTDALAWAGPPWPSVICGGGALPATTPSILVGVTYQRARLWVSLPGTNGACQAGASNGTFASSLDATQFAQRALSTGRWPHAALPAGRLGQQTHMVPGQPAALTIQAGIVHRTYAQDKRDPGRKRTLTTGFGDLITALNSATAKTSTDSCSHSPRPGAKVYQLTFTYAAGPPVALNIMQGCYPEVDNGSLQIRDGQRFFPLIEQLLR